MEWYVYIAWLAIASQSVFTFYCYRNYRYALAKHKKRRGWEQARVALIVPCKGIEQNFDKNIESFYRQDYENYLLCFVVGEETDPAYSRLCRLKELFSGQSRAKEVHIFVAGRGRTCSQKIHNLLYVYEKVSDRVDILAFADSDACLRSDWLRHLIYPLRKSKYGASSGYRWFVPKENNLASLVLSAVNAKVAQLLGNSPYNQVWGGSMATTVEFFRQAGLDKTWPGVLSDDLSLSYAVKKAGKLVAFVPACLVASVQSTNWAELFEFGRRQFLITRVYAPGTWWFGLFSSLYSVLGLYGGAAAAFYAAGEGSVHTSLFTTVPVLFLLGQFIRALLRQSMAGKVLGEYRDKMRAARCVDILACWAWSLLMLVFIVSSAFGRTITWRGIRYKLVSRTETIVLGDKEQPL